MSVSAVTAGADQRLRHPERLADLGPNAIPAQVRGQEPTNQPLEDHRRLSTADRLVGEVRAVAKAQITATSVAAIARTKPQWGSCASTTRPVSAAPTATPAALPELSQVKAWVRTAASTRDSASTDDNTMYGASAS